MQNNGECRPAGVLDFSDCPAQPLLPVWHIVAGSSGLVVPVLYLLFDDLNPALAKRCPGLSEMLDNIVVFVLPGRMMFVSLLTEPETTKIIKSFF